MARGPNLRSEPARWTRDTDNWVRAAPPNYFYNVKTSASWSSPSVPPDAFRYPKTWKIYPLTALFRREGRTFEKTELGKKTLLTKWRCSCLLPWQLSIKWWEYPDVPMTNKILLARVTGHIEIQRSVSFLAQLGLALPPAGVYTYFNINSALCWLLMHKFESL